MSPEQSQRLPMKFLALGALYLSQGLPFGFFVQALPVLLRKQGYSLGAIGLSSMLAVPWGLKFLWSPAVDRYSWPRFGHRRSWIVPAQLLSIMTLVGLAFLTWRQHMTLVLTGVLLSNLMTATQDIATDGMAVDLMRPEERGVSNGLKVAGYRGGMIIGGGALLAAYSWLHWEGTFLAMAALIVVASGPVFAVSDRKVDRRDAKEGGAAVHYLRRPGVGRILLILVTYKLGDAFAVGMVKPFFVDLGLSLVEIGWIVGTVGFVSGLLGAVCGGALVNRLGRRRALVGFGGLQALTVAGYAVLAATRPGLGWLGLLCAAEHFAGGMATAALFTCMMDWSSRTSSATDFSVQASTVVIAEGAAAVLAGFSAQTFGYFAHFGLAALLAAGALAIVYRWYPGPSEIASVITSPSEAVCA